MLDRNFVVSITERDIDLLLLEELSVSVDFCHWFAGKAVKHAQFTHPIQTLHSVSDPVLGESDLVCLFEEAGSVVHAILIENKVDAPAQPEQGARYQLRGQKGVNDGLWDKFSTCLVAPDKYLNSTKQSQSYDAEVSYEDLISYFQGVGLDPARAAYKVRVITEGIEQNRNGYQAKPDDDMTAFVTDYVQYASSTFPELGVQEAGPRPAGNTWIDFFPSRLPSDVKVVHQMTAGYVKLIFPGRANQLSAFEDAWGSTLPDEVTLTKAGKSLALSVSVPPLDPLTYKLSEQRESVDVALRSLNRMALDFASRSIPTSGLA